MKEKRKTSNDKIIEGYDYLGKSCSATDCTGLMPTAPTSDAEQESYEELYHFRPQVIPKNKRTQ